MAKEIKKHNAPESAKWWNIWNYPSKLYRFSPLGNEIGAVGDEGDPDASEKDAEIEDDWEVSPIGEEKEEVSEEESPDDKKSADDAQKKDEKEVEDKKKEGEEKEETEEEKKAKGEDKKAKEKAETEKVEDVEPTEKEAQLTAELEQANKRAEFFSTKYNEFLDEPEAKNESKIQADKETIPGKEISKDVVKPGDWETQEQTAAYFENRAASVAQEVTRVAIKAVEAQLEGVRKELNLTREHLIKFIHSDYDEVAQRAWDDVFVMNDKGKIDSVKDQALLDYFKASPFPQLAVYEHGLAKQAPKKIKEGIKKQTEKTLEKVSKKPKGATQPDSGDATVEVTPLDWDTPQAEADAQLKKEGLI